MIKIEYFGEKVRLDKYLSKELNISRAKILENIRNENILVNNKPSKASYLLNNGDAISGEIVLAEISLEAENIPIDILYEDEDIIVINKNYGLVVHPSISNKTSTLVNALVNYGCTLSDIGGEDRPGIVHRLDKDTSGAMIVCKTNQAHIKLKEDFMNHRVKKTYIAIACGKVDYKFGTIDKKIGRDPITRVKMAVDGINPKEAITEYEVLEENNGFLLLKVNILTGRTHQIRVHMASINCPILGDDLYGPKRKKIKVDRQMLHSYSVEFDHPLSGKKMKIIAPIDQSFIDGLNKVGINGEKIINR